MRPCSKDPLTSWVTGPVSSGLESTSLDKSIDKKTKLAGTNVLLMSTKSLQKLSGACLSKLSKDKISQITGTLRSQARSTLFTAAYDHARTQMKGRKTHQYPKPCLTLFAPTRSHPARTRVNPADLTQILTQASRCERTLGLLHRCIKLHMLS